MTQIEMEYFQTMITTMHEISESLKKLNKTLEQIEENIYKVNNRD